MSKARAALQDLAEILHAELKDTQWIGPDLSPGFGADAYLDYRDAEFHLRALWRLVDHNERREAYKE